MEELGLSWPGAAEVAGVSAEPDCSSLFFCSTFHDKRFHSSRSKGETVNEKKMTGRNQDSKYQVMKNIA